MTKEELIKEIEHANIAYSAGIPFMTDAEYDLLWQQLYAIDPTNELLYHTAQERSNLTGKTWHKYPIYGTNKAFSMEDLKPYLMRFGAHLLSIEPKYDGCAAVITRTPKGITLTLEGDGRCGSDVSHMLNFIQYDFPLMNFQAVEILLPWKDWNPDYGKNPRNVVAGWLARKYDAPETIMTAIPHNHGSLSEQYSYTGDLEEFEELLLTLYEKWHKIYPIDGLMIKVADEKQRLISGNNGQTNHWSIAWKPPIQTKETIVTDIEWNISRLGRVIPTVVYKPIDLCGTTNTRVTGNNAQWLKEKRITIGSKITVGKAGEIIPKILSVKSTTSCVLPRQCHRCLEILEEDGVHLVCNGPDCIAKKIVSIAYFYSDKGVKIDGIGEKLIEKLLSNENCFTILSNSPWALLDMHSYNILHSVIDAIGETIFSNILNEVNKVNNTRNMAHFVSGLGLPGLSYKSALRLCQFLKTGKLGINVPIKARNNFPQAVLKYAEAEKTLKNFSFKPLPNASQAIFCITGTLSMSRDEMINYLESKNFGFSSSVTKETNYLIVGESPGKIKINKAEKHNIPQINEAQLFKLLKEI